jgi:CheY-like chemotaxis protein
MIREIRGRENLQIVAVTAQAMSGDREKSLAAGADYYVSKPVDVDKLLGILQNC